MVFTSYAGLCMLLETLCYLFIVQKQNERTLVTVYIKVEIHGLSSFSCNTQKLNEDHMNKKISYFRPILHIELSEFFFKCLFG